MILHWELALPLSELSPQQISTIVESLQSHFKERGPTILGAQLGALLNAAIRPDSLREYGGMSHVAKVSLSRYIQSVPRTNLTDVMFEIRGSSVEPIRRVPDTPVETTGAELWRFFSNPRIPGFLMAMPSGTVYACTTIPSGTLETGVLTRPTSTHYLTLAQQFAQQIQEPARQHLMATLEKDNFYNDWIIALRNHCTTEANLVKRWEILRTENVAKWLSTALVGAGVDVVRAAEIVAAARPGRSSRQRLVGEHSQTSELAKLPPAQHEAMAKEMNRNPQDELGALRRALHNAIDIMSLKDLEALPIPAGIMVAATLQSQQ